MSSQFSVGDRVEVDGKQGTVKAVEDLGGVEMLRIAMDDGGTLFKAASQVTLAGGPTSEPDI